MKPHDRPWIVGATILLIGLAVVVIQPGVGSPIEIQVSRANLPPSASHWVGTDALGRDLWSRLVCGGRGSLAAGLIALACASLLATLAAIAALGAPRWIDPALRRIADACAAFPMLLAVLAVGAWARGISSAPATPLWVGITVGLVGWPLIFRLVRAEGLRLRGTDRFVAALALGQPDWRALRVHVLLDALRPGLVPAIFLTSGALVVDATLAFVGLGAEPPTPSWGNMLGDAFATPNRPWWQIAAPGGALCLVTGALTLIAESVRQRSSARAREVRG